MADNILDRFDQIVEDEKKTDSGKKVRVGIIGTGWIAEAHVKNYKELPDVEIVAGCDLVPGKAAEFFKIKSGCRKILREGSRG